MFFLTQNFCADSSVLLLKTVVFTTFSRIKLIETSMSTPKIEIYISVDVETSGPIPGEYSLLSIGARSVGHPEQNFYSELKPINNNFIPKALEVNGLSMEKLKVSGEAPAAAMARFENWIIKMTAGKYRPVFTAFNATFDWMFTHWYFMKFLGRDPFGISGLDIKAYFMGKHQGLWGEAVKNKIRPSALPRLSAPGPGPFPLLRFLDNCI